MRRQYVLNFGQRPTPPSKQHAAPVSRSARKRGVLVNQRVRGVPRAVRRSFVPPEDWHEPREDRLSYRFVIQQPGDGYRHVLTPDDIRARLALLPEQFLENLEVVQLSRMTRKKQCFPCYGMQWGSTLYLYPIEEDLVEEYDSPPRPAQRMESAMYGGVWEPSDRGGWRLVWNDQAIRDFYLNNILIHELGHLVDARNSSYADRERFAEWFAVQYGYRPSRRGLPRRPVVRRHG